MTCKFTNTNKKLTGHITTIALKLLVEHIEKLLDIEFDEDDHSLGCPSLSTARIEESYLIENIIVPHALLNSMSVEMRCEEV